MLDSSSPAAASKAPAAITRRAPYLSTRMPTAGVVRRYPRVYAVASVEVRALDQPNSCIIGSKTGPTSPPPDPATTKHTIATLATTDHFVRICVILTLNPG